MMPNVLTQEDAEELRVLVAELKASHRASISAEVADWKALALRKSRAVQAIVDWREQPW